MVVATVMAMVMAVVVVKVSTRIPSSPSTLTSPRQPDVKSLSLHVPRFVHPEGNSNLFYLPLITPFQPHCCSSSPSPWSSWGAPLSSGDELVG